MTVEKEAAAEVERMQLVEAAAEIRKDLGESFDLLAVFQVMLAATVVAELVGALAVGFGAAVAFGNSSEPCNAVPTPSWPVEGCHHPYRQRSEEPYMEEHRPAVIPAT